MALNPAGLKSKMKNTIYNGLKAQFSASAAEGVNYTPEADAQWQKMAEAISGIAADIVTEIVTDAEVAPGIPVNGTTFMTAAPGKIT
jgi:hypothetical protein